MNNNRKSIISLTLTLFLLVGCSGKGAEAEIKIPIYETEQKRIESVSVSRMDLSLTQAVPASVGYLFADQMRAPAAANIIEWNAALNKTYAEGETIAAFDASSLAYDRTAQELVFTAARGVYEATGSRADFLRFEIERLKLEKIDSEIAAYTVKAPYDCVLVQTERFSVGDAAEAGAPLFYIAEPDDVNIFCYENPEYFRLGADVTVRLANTDYAGKVISCPSVLPRGANYNLREASLIKMNEGELERMLEDTPNLVTAGWATVYVRTAEKYGVLGAADAAVKEYNGNIYCNLMQADGRKVQVSVETGESVNGYTVIKSGLDEGDILAVN